MQRDRYEWAKQRTEEEWQAREKLVRRALFNLGIRGDLANDLVQDTFERLFIQLIERDEPQSYPKWLTTVALNLGRNHFDRSSNKNHFSIDEDDEQFDEAEKSSKAIDWDSDGEELSTSDYFSNKNLSVDCVKMKLRYFREKQPKKYFAICLYKDEYSISEIAEIIDRSEHATRQFLYECRKALLPLLKECLD